MNTSLMNENSTLLMKGPLKYPLKPFPPSTSLAPSGNPLKYQLVIFYGIEECVYSAEHVLLFLEYGLIDRADFFSYRS